MVISNFRNGHVTICISKPSVEGFEANFDILQLNPNRHAAISSLAPGLHRKTRTRDLLNCVEVDVIFLIWFQEPLSSGFRQFFSQPCIAVSVKTSVCASDAILAMYCSERKNLCMCL
jgi:hypothetical protein